MKKIKYGKLQLRLLHILVGMTTVSLSCSPVVKEKKPNIIVVITDDQNRSELNVLDRGKDADGRPLNITPTLDQLAAEGTVLTSFYACATVCTPTRYNVLTGTYAGRAINPAFLNFTELNGGQTCVQWNSHIMPEDMHIAKALKQSGYTTGFVGKNHTYELPKDKSVGIDADPRNPAIASILRNNQEEACQTLKDAFYYDYASNVYNGNPGTCRQLEFHNNDWIFDGALTFLQENKDDSKPFFLHIATTIHHGPRTIEKNVLGNPLATPAGFLDDTLRIMPSRADVMRRVREAGYDDNASTLLWLDDGFSALINKLKETGEYDNTVIIYFNDQGSDDGGKGSLYEGGSRSYGFISGYGIRGQKLDALTGNVDIFPTILDLCGIHQAFPLDGVSLKPLLEGKKEQVRESLYLEMGNSRGVVTSDRWKYIALRHSTRITGMSFEQKKKILDARIARDAKWGKEWKVKDPSAPFDHLGQFPGGTASQQTCMKVHPAYHDPDQLYNLHWDALELQNLSGSNPDKLMELQDILQDYLVNMPGTFGKLKD